MKRVALSAGLCLLLLAVHGHGYWQGMRSSQERAVMVGARYATLACVAQNLVELRQITRLIEAKRRQPLDLERQR